jgi:putative pyruvate formate lyase activating enzyme
MRCKTCPHNCLVDRTKTKGFCFAPAGLKISHLQLHHWEEPCISGQNGSGTIFFTHCNLKCVFCQNYQISQQGLGKEVSAEKFIGYCHKLKKQGAVNLNLVSPTCYTDLLVKILPKIKKQINLPIIWNSNAYEKVETLKKLEGLVDIYLPDYKYNSSVLAWQYSGIKNYGLVALSAINEMVKQVERIEIDEYGLIKKGVLIRHLVLPGQIEDSKQILRLIKNNFNSQVWVSLMTQYYPTYLANNFADIDKTLTQAEVKEINDFYENLNFAGGYLQSLTSASANFTPQWQIELLD